MNILIVEDDSAAALLLQQGLAGLGYRSDIARNGEFGLEMARGGNFDLWIVDVMMPIMNGLTMLRTLRDEGNNTPALVLSALGEVDERVEGLRSGGDDYLVKPYAFSELQARIEALLRRTRSMSAQETVLEVGDLKLDLLTRKVIRAGQEIFLKPRELRLLEYLMRHAGQVVTRTMLLENVWDYYFDPQTNVVDVHISRLRQQIDKCFPAPLLHTVRGEGYLMRVE
ncbi:MAG: response regulator transcription factor [Sulfurimicrobium sp.]|nr:response regulator transcription factor [Sulfurimicrobium sp.]MDP1705513.1 response regulator transcription factor [Sulfurimicrobium sp.]MDP2200006.1 response regulator transcription factor [Sulfurimicrobium sp.]MDP3687727.1 response regulator transcription factor [Sulfurimicrobium sp.]